MYGFEVVRCQGTDEIVDYTVTPIEQALSEPVDAVLNLVPVQSPEQAAKSAALVRPGGKVVSIAGAVPVDEASGTTTVYFGVRTELAEIHRRGDVGQLRGEELIVP
ncbi:zinc-binding dehydrogenase [Catenulispora subtropica]|uniref:Uncharacterized protein n=1 Tax=Catenulispora subtropica TaxID=450798 RepID=A0ABN2R8C2_9ACTN